MTQPGKEGFVLPKTENTGELITPPVETAQNQSPEVNQEEAAAPLQENPISNPMVENQPIQNAQVSAPEVNQNANNIDPVTAEHTIKKTVEENPQDLAGFAGMIENLNKTRGDS